MPGTGLHLLGWCLVRPRLSQPSIPVAGSQKAPGSSRGLRGSCRPSWPAPLLPLAEGGTKGPGRGMLCGCYAARSSLGQEPWRGGQGSCRALPCTAPGSLALPRVPHRAAGVAAGSWVLWHGWEQGHCVCAALGLGQPREDTPLCHLSPLGLHLCPPRFRLLLSPQPPAQGSGPCASSMSCSLAVATAPEHSGGGSGTSTSPHPLQPPRRQLTVLQGEPRALHPGTGQGLLPGLTCAAPGKSLVTAGDSTRDRGPRPCRGGCCLVLVVRSVGWGTQGGLGSGLSPGRGLLGQQEVGGWSAQQRGVMAG